MRDDDDSSPFHAGERAAQTRAGVRDKIEAVGGRFIRDAMPDQHRELFEELPMVILGSLDRDGRPWASARFGWPGFVRAPDARRLEIDATAVGGDPAAAHLAVGAPVGVLGIQLETRRRNRMNGRIAAVTPAGLAIDVDQSFGNCPQYIRPRAPVALDAGAAPAAARAEGARLSAGALALIARADTFFIATASAHPDSREPREGVDVSHRGGDPGFVTVGDVADRSVLTWPDFRGNYMFQTLGNLEVNPRAGLLFLDFATGDLLALTGDATVRWSEPRTVELRVTAGAHLPRAMPLRWDR